MGVLQSLLGGSSKPSVQTSDPSLRQPSTATPVVSSTWRTTATSDLETKILNVPKPLHGKIIGKGGAVVKGIQERSQCRISFPQSTSGPQGIVLVGQPLQVNEAVRLISDLVPTLCDDTTLSIPIKKEYHKLIVGKHGENIQDLQRSLRVYIAIPAPTDPSDVVCITGDAASVDNAKGKLEQFVVDILTPVLKAQAASGYHREDAAIAAQKRAEIFEQSRKAFEEGRKAEAKALSLVGKQYTEKMEHENKQASLAAFQALNKATEPFKLDLHGQHQDEALRLLEERIKILERSQHGEWLDIITGQGVHSDRSGPKIRPAVIEYLTKRRAKFECRDKGVVSVFIA